MIAADDLVWITLTSRRVAWLDEVAKLRQDSNVEARRVPKNNAPNNYASALALHAAGLPGECAAMIYLSPVTWHYFKTGSLIGLADIEDWIDVKTRRQSSHRLIVQYDDESDWAYVFACRAQFPRMCLIGWCWGYEAKQQQYKDDPVGNRPAYWVPQQSPILKPMRELRALLRKRQEKK